MKFDKSKVYTILNKDDVKPGMIGYVTNDLASLKLLVENDRNHCLKTLNRIIPASDKDIYCFAVEDGKQWAYFYRVKNVNEVTAKTWDGHSRIMKVWNDSYNNPVEAMVVHIYDIADVEYPILAVFEDSYGTIHRYQHCAELEVKED